MGSEKRGRLSFNLKKKQNKQGSNGIDFEEDPPRDFVEEVPERIERRLTFDDPEGTSEYQDELSTLKFDRDRMIVDIQALHREIQVVEGDAKEFAREIQERPVVMVSESDTEDLQAAYEESQNELTDVRRRLAVLETENTALKLQNKDLAKEAALLRAQDPAVLDHYTDLHEERLLRSEASAARLEELSVEFAKLPTVSLQRHQAYSHVLRSVAADVRNSLSSNAEAELSRYEAEQTVQRLKRELFSVRAKLAAIENPQEVVEATKGSNPLDIDDPSPSAQVTSEWQYSVDVRIDAVLDLVHRLFPNSPLPPGVKLNNHSEGSTSGRAARVLDLPFSAAEPIYRQSIAKEHARTMDSQPQTLDSLKGEMVTVFQNLFESETQLQLEAFVGQRATILASVIQLLEKCRGAHATLAAKIPDSYPIPEIDAAIKEESKHVTRIQGIISSKTNLSQYNKPQGQSVEQQRLLATAELSQSFARVMRVYFTLLYSVMSTATNMKDQVKQREAELQREVAERLRIQGDSDRRLQEIQATLNGMSLVLGNGL